MYAQLGFFLLALALMASIYGTLASLASSRIKDNRLFISAKIANLVSTLLILLAGLLLVILLFQRDYSLSYIYKNSSDDLPLLYTFSAFWSALEGSHFLWTSLLALVSSLALYTYTPSNRHLIPYVSAVLQAVMTWMLYMATSYSDPFTLILPVPENGLGMNTLLQNPYMVIHPPALFTGYTTLAVPFAYSAAALMHGDITAGWLKTVRRWALIAWSFLTIGIFLGGRWAYVELGWAGYWAWDPVENSSLIPWLFTTALIHSLIVQGKIGHLKKTSLVLSFLAFFFTYFGTFITRSGLIESVHSFAQSQVGTSYLILLLILFLSFLCLYLLRAQLILPADEGKAWGLSKESALILSQFLLLSFVTVVILGTLYPFISEFITGSRYDVQAPYYNSFAPYIGFAMIISLSIGNLLHYGKQQLKKTNAIILKSIFLSLPLTALFTHYGDVFLLSSGSRLWIQIIGIQLCFWSFVCLTWDLFQRFFKVQKARLQRIWIKERSYLGAYLAHIGCLIAILGFLGNYRGLEQTTTLYKGQKINFYGYDITFTGMLEIEDDNTILHTASLKLRRDKQERGFLLPARAKYPTKDELVHEVGIQSNFWHDLYAVLADFDTKHGAYATLQIHINPTVRLVWLAGLFMFIGGLLASSHRVRGQGNKEILSVNS